RQLQQLALEAQQQPPKSRTRRLALTRLVQGIQESGRLSRKKYDCSQEVYDEALQEVWLYVFRKIDAYEPRSSVINWVNSALKWRLIDALNRHTKKGRECSLDAPINSSPNQSGMKYLDTFDQPEATLLPSQLVRRCIEEDPEGLFASKHVRGHPQANFRTIALLHLDGNTWQEVAVAVGLGAKKESTVQSFYSRCCRIFADKIKGYLQA
ncbi:MAG: sigma-70 family RNA polymerase sigma factor, partial [Symploca sp. SIO2E6]|nr:sigma-70 family RNA polymerase sigma factor [Symploca sp. SIO2E6]